MSDRTRTPTPSTPPPDINADHALERFPPGADPVRPEEERPLADDTRGAGDQAMRDTEGNPAIRGGTTGLGRADRR